MLPTKRQKQLLDYVARYIERYGFAPTYVEMKGKLKVNSLATIADHLKALSQKKLIKIYKGAVRGVEILNTQLTANNQQLNLELPFLGYIAAGRPIEVIAQTETVVVPSLLVSPHRKSFVLKIKGESMIEEGIFDGDYVIVEEANDAANGEIIIALVNDSFATLKKFYREKGRIRLEPANAKMAPIYATNVTIQGKVKGLYRKF